MLALAGEAQRMDQLPAQLETEQALREAEVARLQQQLQLAPQQAQEYAQNSMLDRLFKGSAMMADPTASPEIVRRLEQLLGLQQSASPPSARMQAQQDEMSRLAPFFQQMQ